MAYGDNFKIFGPYCRKDGRKIVIVVERNGKRRTISYPKWVMELHLGRRLDPDLETVDHWDSNHENNDVSNLRLVPRDQHSADDTRRVKHVKLTCAWCDEKFERSPRIVRDKAKKKKAGPFCSRKCAGKYSRMLQLKLITKFKSQKPIKSEYYKRKYVTASQIIWEDDIDFLDLMKFASEDDFLYHETSRESLESIIMDGLVPTSYGQSFVNEHGEVDSPEFALDEIRNRLSEDESYSEMSDDDFEARVSEEFQRIYSEEDLVPRTYVHLKEPYILSDGSILLRFPKVDIDVKEDVDHYILEIIPASKLEIKTDSGWENLIK